MRRLLGSAWLVLAGSGREVVPKSNPSFIIIHCNTKNHTPWGKAPRPFLTEHTWCENTDQEFGE